MENYGVMEAILARLVKVQMPTLFESTSKNKGVKATNCVFLISPRRKAPQLAAIGIASEVGLLLKKIIGPLFIKIFVKKINNLKPNYPKSFIIALNHASYLDPPITESIFIKNINRKVHFIGKEELFSLLPSRIFHEAVGTINLNYSRDKGRSALKTAIKHLKNGKIIGIFPEGIRSPTGKLMKGKVGIAKLVIKSRVPVLPVGIKGTNKLLPVTKSIPRFKKKVVLNIGELMYFDKYYNRKFDKKTLREITDKIMKEIAKLCRQKYSY